MEINLLSKHGIADDFILSIRAGAFKRQAPVDSGRPFRFPKLGMEENPVRVEILQQVGLAELVMKPNESQYQVLFDSGGKCEVEVRATTENAEEANADVTEGRENSDTLKEAKGYLEQHQLLQFVQGVLQAVIRAKPKNPFSYMARHFMSGYELERQTEPSAVAPGEEAQPQTATEASMPQELLSKPAAATTAVLAPEDTAPLLAPALATSEATQVVIAHEASQQATAPAQSKPELAQHATAANEEVPGPVSDESVGVEGLRAHVQDTILPATEDHNPCKRLEVLRHPVAQKAEQAQHPQAEQARHHQVQVDNLRLRMKDTLLKATEDRTLLVAMHTVLAEQTAKRAAAENLVVGTDELTKQAREIVSEAEQDDNLGAAVECAVTDDQDAVGMQDIRAKARQVLEVSCKDMMEDEVTQKDAEDTAEHSAAVDQFRGKAASVFAEATNGGTLGGALEAGVAEPPNGTDAQQDPLDRKPEDLHVRMKDTLLQATKNGSLLTAMEKALRDVREVELRTQVIDVVPAAVVGTMEVAMKGARGHGSIQVAS